MKRLLVMLAAAAALTSAQNATAKSVRLREAARGEGLEVRAKSAPTGGRKFGKLPSGRNPSAAEAAAALGGALGVDVSLDELAVQSDDVDRFGRRHVRLRQVYKGLEVDARELIVHFGADGRVYEVNGDWLDGLALSATPAVHVEGAALVVFCKGDDAAAARLAWKKRHGRNFVFTDALTGETLHVRAAGPRHAQAGDDDSDDDDYDPLDSDKLVAKASTTAFPEGTATTIQGRLPVQQGGAAVEIGTTRAADGRTYLATTTEDGIEIGVLDGLAAPKYRAGATAAYAEKRDAWFDWFVDDTWWSPYSEDPAEDMPNAIAIIHNIGTVLSYYKTAFNRTSYDGRGGRVAAWRFWQNEGEDINTAFDNAFWSSMDDAAKTNGCFFFGYDLSGTRSETSFDTCAHELTHGITSWTSDLIYEGESGALNESFSDLIAAAAEFATQPRAADPENPRPGEADWLFDEDSGTPARSYAKPQLYDQPSRYRGTSWVDTSDTSDDNDYGGVHSNSGVQNHFFYLLSEGGRGRNDGVEYDLKGIGVEKAAQIAYLALTAYCVKNTNYGTVQACWDSAARDLVESGVLTEDDYEALAPAWAAVMSAPNDSSCGETVYANENGLLVKVGAPNAKGVSRTTLMITMDTGDVVKLSGKAQGNEAVLSKRSVGTANITLGPDSAVVSMDDAEETVQRVSPLVNAVDGLEDLHVGVAFERELELDDAEDAALLRWSGRKLPLGVRVVSKSGTIAGVPRKAGRGEGKVEAKCSFVPVGQEKPMTAKVARKVKWSVAPLDEWAQGRFAGDGVSVTIGKSGRIKGNAVVNGKRLGLSAKSFTNYADGKYYSAGKTRGGGTFVITASEGGLSIMLVSDSAVELSATRQ